MNTLYRINFSHHAPKDAEYGIKGYLFASSDEDVFNWIVNSKDQKGFNNFYMSWEDEDFEEDEEPLYEITNDKWDVIASFNNKKDFIMALKGDINDKNYDFSDSYYGCTRLGWELVSDSISDEQKDFMINNGIAV